METQKLSAEQRFPGVKRVRVNKDFLSKAGGNLNTLEIILEKYLSGTFLTSKENPSYQEEYNEWVEEKGEVEKMLLKKINKLKSK